MWFMAQNDAELNPLGVLVQPKEGSGGDFWDLGLTIYNFWIYITMKFNYQILVYEVYLKNKMKPYLHLNGDP